jgi:hypothetical protein
MSQIDNHAGPTFDSLLWSISAQGSMDPRGIEVDAK